jgi:dTDP-4-amino-4,6-dideoxygalactose transaminase
MSGRVEGSGNVVRVIDQGSSSSGDQYAREYCTTGLAHSANASPFKDFSEWPAKGYRKEDFPKTESIVHRVVALPIGSMYTEEDAEYIARAVRHVWGDMTRLINSARRA